MSRRTNRANRRLCPCARMCARRRPGHLALGMGQGLSPTPEGVPPDQQCRLHRMRASRPPRLLARGLSGPFGQLHRTGGALRCSLPVVEFVGRLIARPTGRVWFPAPARYGLADRRHEGLSDAPDHPRTSRGVTPIALDNGMSYRRTASRPPVEPNMKVRRPNGRSVEFTQAPWTSRRLIHRSLGVRRPARSRCRLKAAFGRRRDGRTCPPLLATQVSTRRWRDHRATVNARLGTCLQRLRCRSLPIQLAHSRVALLPCRRRR